jgi:hypothetical protein
MQTPPENKSCDKTACTGPVPGNASCEACRLSLANSAAKKKLALFPLSGDEAEILGELAHGGAKSVCRFVMSSSREKDLEAVALAPVLIRGPEDTVEAVRERGKILTGLLERGLITLEYGSPLPGFDERTVRESAAFSSFEDTVREGAGKPGFLFDTAKLEAGRMEMTDDGAQAMLDYYRL